MEYFGIFGIHFGPKKCFPNFGNNSSLAKRIFFLPAAVAVGWNILEYLEYFGIYLGTKKLSLRRKFFLPAAASAAVVVETS